MTPEEKIEALREWVANNNRPDFGTFAAGHLTAVNEVHEILDSPPEWRKRVDALHPKGVTGTHLGAALYHLSHVANPDHYDVAEELANIVVVCEVAVGGGWRADPDDAYSLPSASDIDQCTAMWLMDSLVRYFEPANYRNTGNRAAHWLRGLTDGVTK